MKCSNCGGTGKEYWNGNVFCNTGFECDKCNGTGEIELVQTNEEWLDTLSTEEKAKWLEDKMTWAAQEQGTFTAKGWEMWLKQPHKPIS
jgi:hypothetical protein